MTKLFGVVHFGKVFQRNYHKIAWKLHVELQSGQAYYVADDHRYVGTLIITENNSLCDQAWKIQAWEKIRSVARKKINLKQTSDSW